MSEWVLIIAFCAWQSGCAHWSFDVQSSEACMRAAKIFHGDLGSQGTVRCLNRTSGEVRRGSER